MHKATPALVLGTGVTALGVLRVLARNGITGFATDAADPVARSSRAFHRLPGERPAFEDRELESWLPDLPLDRAVLIPCSDHWVRRVAQLDPMLRRRFPVSVSAPDTIDCLVDKGRFAEALRAHGIPHPFSRLIDQGTDLDGVPDAVFASAILKPRDSQRFIQRYRVKALHVRSRDEATKQLSELVAAGHPVILQEYIPGAATQHYFVDGFIDRSGRVTGIFVRQRLRMYPLDFGNSTYMISVPPKAARGAVDAITSLLTKLSYRGMFSAEFKLDPRDGIFKILEVNARAWWYVDFAARCGVDVVRMSYDDALGQEVQTVSAYAVGRTLVYPYSDYFACRALQRAGKLSGWQWLRSWASSMQPVLTLRDPLPGLRAASSVLSGFAMRRIRSLISRN